MVAARSRRLRLLESLRRTLSEKLHDRVIRTAHRQGQPQPENTSAIYVVAKDSEPDLLDQLLLVHQRVCEERGETAVGSQPPAVDDRERQRMLSAVRATVQQSAIRFSG